MTDLDLELHEPGSLVATRTTAVVAMLSLASLEVNDMNLALEAMPLDYGAIVRIARAYGSAQARQTTERLRTELAAENVNSLGRAMLADYMESTVVSVLDDEITQREQVYTLGTGYEIVLPKTSRLLVKRGLQGEFATIPHVISDLEIPNDAAGRTTQVIAMRRLLTVQDYLVECLRDVA